MARLHNKASFPFKNVIDGVIKKGPLYRVIVGGIFFNFKSPLKIANKRTVALFKLLTAQTRNSMEVHSVSKVMLFLFVMTMTHTSAK